MSTLPNDLGSRFGLRLVLFALTTLGACSDAEPRLAPSESAEQVRGGEPELWTPEPDGWLTDLAGLFSSERAEELEKALAAYEAETRNEFVVLTVNGLRGEAIESFARRVGNSWEIGKADADNGLVIVVAVEERRARIEVSRGLEAAISDALAQEVMERDMTPAFRDERHADGIEAGLQSLMALAR